MRVAGVDGCRGGWVGVQIKHRDETGTVSIFPDIQALWDTWSDLTCILIDIPIGLKEWGPAPRGCDGEARRILRRPRSSSIFPVPCRAAVYATTYLEACAINREKTTKGISKQAWNIVPKIRQVDTLLRNTPAARRPIRETHPEVCFWGLAGGQAILNYKKTALGIQERVTLLERLFPKTRKLISNTVTTFSRDILVIDDVVDALALAVTALHAGDNLESIPSKQEWDGEGLPMEICFLRVKREGSPTQL
jgi:predicted RNase H-like nuclease